MSVWSTDDCIQSGVILSSSKISDSSHTKIFWNTFLMLLAYMSAEMTVTKNADMVEKAPEHQAVPRVSRRAYNRWMVAYTLIRNESLIVSPVSQCISIKGCHHFVTYRITTCKDIYWECLLLVYFKEFQHFIDYLFKWHVINLSVH